jgi:starch synthase (maltosyl-transferring)
MSSPPKKRPPRIQIESVWPQLDCGRYPIKRTVGEPVTVWATVFRDGHEQLRAAVRYRPGAGRWREVPLEHVEADRWTAAFTPDEVADWEFHVRAWVDRYASWREELRRKADAHQEDLSSELAEGAALFGLDSITLADGLASTEEDRSEVTDSVTLRVAVDDVPARFGAWYELFPRSWGGFRGVAKVLPELRELGFDVVYLPPIHPIGTTNRKGRNNALAAAEGDPGSPWAIGSAEGGHDAINPELGTWADFDAMVEAARRTGIELALDFAIQCSPDHPWLREHPEWFHRRPDGTLKYAENPPKRYQDIYNVNFDSEDWQGLWQALLDIVLFWVGRGIRVFRVDNPHTKPVPFWEWLIREVRGVLPDVIFLAEAFTRPAMMQTLGKAGFNQSYTYFTWKNTRWELQEFMAQVLSWRDYYRPNFFANTPDILHEYLQLGGRPAFEARLVLAATLSPSYGIYSGYEHVENVPVRAGSEEYLDSEKYETKERALGGPLLPLVQRLNEVRRARPQLQVLDNLTWLETESEHLVAYAKGSGLDALICVVNLDPFTAHEGVCILPVQTGFPPAFHVRDQLSGRLYDWRIGRNYVRLDAGGSHIMALERG